MTDPNIMLRRTNVENVAGEEIERLIPVLAQAEEALADALQGPRARYTTDAAILQKRAYVNQLKGRIECLTGIAALLNKCARFTVTRVDEEDILLDQRGGAVRVRRIPKGVQ